MVDKARHPLDERYIDAYAVQGEPVLVDADWTPRWVPCPLCHGELLPTNRSRGGYRYFMHRDDADEQNCPLSTPSYQPAGMSISHERDPLIELAHRPRFLRNWKWHYRIAKHAAPSLRLEQFMGLIEYADVMNLWSYPRLDHNDLPYVLLVMAGFMTARGPDSEVTRERFYFDGSVRDVGDLWREGRRMPSTLFRIVYRNPLHTPFPTSASIQHWQRVARVTRLADIEVPRVTRVQMQAFERFMERHEVERRERGTIASGGSK